MLTLFPLTVYLPFSVLLYFLSDSGIFESSAVCAVGMLEVLILKSLQKILISFIAAEMDARRVLLIMGNAVVVLAAAVLVFIAFRFIDKPFRLCVAMNRRNRLLLSVPIVLVFMMMFYFLNSTTSITVLFLMMRTAVVVDKHSEEHGIGLHSVNRIAEKYNGFVRCKLEKGEFVFHALLFREESVPVKNVERLGLGVLLMLNVMPSTAQAASSLLSVNIRTIRDLVLGWGDTSILILPKITQENYLRQKPTVNNL